MCNGNQSQRNGSSTEKPFAERVADARAAVASIDPQAANAERRREPETLFIDPRDAASIAATTGMIPGALSVPLATLSAGDDTPLPPVLDSRERLIITACQAGPMGAVAAHELKKRGYTNVRYLEGGTQAWIDAGYSTDR